jgi:hypothetical protein
LSVSDPVDVPIERFQEGIVRTRTSPTMPLDTGEIPPEDLADNVGGQSGSPVFVRWIAQW